MILTQKHRSVALAAITAATLTACSNIPHDKDTLYVDGFIAPLGESPLLQINPEASMTISLKKGDTVISESQLSAPSAWPSAYKLEFHPPQMDAEEGDLSLTLSIVTKGDTTLVYDQPIKLSSPVLFATQQNIVVSAYSVNNATDDQQRESNQQAEDELYETFLCSDGSKDIRAALHQNYIILPNHSAVLPRLLTTPLPYYRTSHLTLSFNEDRSFVYQRDDESTICQLNEASFNPYKTSQELVKKAVATQEELDKKASQPQK